ncbi:MAG: Gfo/Idh/MocA family protein [Spirochaetota bacterium]
MNTRAERPALPCIALIGSGKWMRSHHLPLARRLEDQGELVIAGLWNRTVSTARTLAGLHGVSHVYESIEELLADQSVTGAVVCVSKEAVYRVLSRIASRGWPLLVEKPPGNSVEEAQHLTDMIGDRAIVGFNRRFAPSVGRFKALLEESAPVYHIECQFTRRKRSDSRFVTETGIHAIDLIRWLLGPVSSVHARAYTAKAVDGGAPVISHWHASLEFDCGASAHISFLPHSGFSGERYTAYAPDRTIVLDYACYHCDGSESRVTSYNADGEISTFERMPGECDPYREEGFVHEYHAFLDLVAGGTPSISTVSSACSSLEIAEQIQSGEITD